MTAHAPLFHNQLLAMLPAAELARLEPCLEAVELEAGELLHAPDEEHSGVWFPAGAVISLGMLLDDGATIEVAMVGSEGLLGASRVLGGGGMPWQASVQIGGAAFRLKSALLAEAMERDERVRHCLLRYAQTLLAQVAQGAACNQHHSVEQQLCRWLLQVLDRIPGSRILATQERIAGNLGVRREGVTVAAKKLQRLGIVDYGRGCIVVLDRARLTEMACECYAAIRREEERFARFDNASMRNRTDQVARYS